MTDQEYRLIISRNWIEKARAAVHRDFVKTTVSNGAISANDIKVDAGVSCLGNASSRVVLGDGGVAVNSSGSGAVTLTAVNTFAGPLAVNVGTLKNGAAGVIAD